MKPRLAIVTPMANEEDTVSEFVTGVLAHLGPEDRLLCIFDRISTDSTQDQVLAMAADDPRVVRVYDEDSRSPVDAYFRGYRDALEGGFDWIIEMDSGLAHPPEQIPRITEALGRGVEFAAGSRFIKGGEYPGTWFHKWVLSWGGTLLANSLLRTGYKDLLSGFKGYTRKALMRVVERGVRSKAHSFQIEVRYMLLDLRWEEVPITYRGASHRIRSKIILNCLANVWVLYRRSKQAVVRFSGRIRRYFTGEPQ